MTKKDINSMSDEDLGNMSAEELAELTAGKADGADEGEGEGEDEGEGADAGDEGEGEGEGGEGEGEGEGEGDPDEAARLAAIIEDDDDDSDDNRMVPYKRLREKAQEASDLRLMLKSVLPGMNKAAEPEPEPEPEPQAPVYDFKAKAREQAKLAAQGMEDEAQTLAEEIEDMRQQVMDFRIAAAERNAERNAESRSKAFTAKQEIEKSMTSIYADYPFLDNTNKEMANEAAIIAVNQKAKLLIADGKGIGEALREAADTIVKQLRKLNGEPDPKRSKATTVDKRTKEAMERGLGFKQPGNGKSGIGNRTDGAGKLKIADMTDKDLDALGEKGLRSLKGYDRIPGS